MPCSKCGHNHPGEKCGSSPAVLQITNKDCTLFHGVTVPAIMGGETENPPKNGLYKNVLLYYEATGNAYFYTSDGIPYKLTYATTDYNALTNKPTVNGVTLEGNKTAANLGIVVNDGTLTLKQGDTVLGTFSANASEDAEINIGNIYEIEIDENEQIYQIYKNGALIEDQEEAFDAISDDAAPQEIRWRKEPGAVCYHKCAGNGYSVLLNFIGGKTYEDECGSDATIYRIALSRDGGYSVDSGSIPFKAQLWLRLYMGDTFVPNGTYQVTGNNPVYGSGELTEYGKLLRYFRNGEDRDSVILTASCEQTGRTLVIGDADYDTENNETVIRMSLMSVVHQEIYSIIFRQDGTYSVTARYQLNTTNLMAG